MEFKHGIHIISSAMSIGSSITAIFINMMKSKCSQLNDRLNELFMQRLIDSIGDSIIWDFFHMRKVW